MGLSTCFVLTASGRCVDADDVVRDYSGRSVGGGGLDQVWPSPEKSPSDAVRGSGVAVPPDDVVAEVEKSAESPDNAK